MKKEELDEETGEILTVSAEDVLEEINKEDALENLDSALDEAKSLIKSSAFNESELNKQLAFFDILVKGKNLPDHVRTKETAFSIYQLGKELGFSPMVSFNVIVPIKGKLSLLVAGQSAILEREGVYTEILNYADFFYIKDGERIYSDVRLYKTDSEEHKKYFRTQITRIKFKRAVMFNGEKIVKEVIATYSVSDAKKAGLLEKDNWQNALAEMLYARAFGRGVKLIAPDLVLGLYNNLELS